MQPGAPQPKWMKKSISTIGTVFGILWTIAIVIVICFNWGVIAGMGLIGASVIIDWAATHRAIFEYIGGAALLIYWAHGIESYFRELRRDVKAIKERLGVDH